MLGAFACDRLVGTEHVREQRAVLGDINVGRVALFFRTLRHTQPDSVFGDLDVIATLFELWDGDVFVIRCTPEIGPQWTKRVVLAQSIQCGHVEQLFGALDVACSELVDVNRLQFSAESGTDAFEVGDRVCL